MVPLSLAATERPACRAAALVALASICLPVRVASVAASTNCPCLTSFSQAWSDVFIVNNGGGDQQIFPASLQNSAGAVDVYYPADYGLNECQSHDNSLAPYCDGPTPADWCSTIWCYVDPNDCIDGEPTVSVREVASGNPYYSYKTCGVDTMNYAKFERTRALNASDIQAEIVSYLQHIRDYVESRMVILTESEGNHAGCTFLDGCSCTSCVEGGGEWRTLLNNGQTQAGYSIDFDAMTVTHRGGLTRTGTEEEMDAQCLSRYVEAEFKSIARQEYNDPARLGFLYYGAQAEGVYFGYPGSTLCTDYDPRFRPWYVSAVSGPKSVMLVIDSSGSMVNSNRWNLATEAVNAVLDTLTEYDFFGLVLFNSVIDTYQATMIQATSANKDDMTSWLSAKFPGGATNFDAAFSNAFQVIDSTHAQSGFSNCNGIMLFLTDGADGSGMDVERVAQLNTRDYAVFTYTFGDGAEDGKPRAIACDNRGIYTHVADGGGIANAMAGYYEYFASDRSFSNSGTVRWTEYDEVVTNREVITGCLPAYDRNVGSDGLVKLHGVVCFDVGLMLNSAEFKSKPDYTQTWALMEASSSDCTQVYPTNVQMDVLRSRVSAFSSCTYGVGTADAAAGLQMRSVSMFAILVVAWATVH